jgi:hypothetical protein
LQAIGRIGRPASPRPLIGEGGTLIANLVQKLQRDREAVHGDLPSLHALLRVAGRGRGWGVYQQNAASMYAAPPPTPDPERLRPALGWTAPRK